MRIALIIFFLSCSLEVASAAPERVDIESKLDGFLRLKGQAARRLGEHLSRAVQAASPNNPALAGEPAEMLRYNEALAARIAARITEANRTGGVHAVRTLEREPIEGARLKVDTVVYEGEVASSPWEFSLRGPDGIDRSYAFRRGEAPQRFHTAWSKTEGNTQVVLRLHGPRPNYTLVPGVAHYDDVTVTKQVFTNPKGVRLIERRFGMGAQDSSSTSSGSLDGGGKPIWRAYWGWRPDQPPRARNSKDEYLHDAPLPGVKRVEGVRVRAPRATSAVPRQ